MSSVAHTTAGRDRFSERDRFLIPAIRVLNALDGSPHAACHLVHTAKLARADVDRALAWLKRRRLVEHEGAWRLTGLGRIAVQANDQSAEAEGVGDAAPAPAKPLGDTQNV